MEKWNICQIPCILLQFDINLFVDTFMEVMYLAATWWSCIYAVLPPGDRADVCVNITTGQVNKVCRITVSGNVYG